MDKTSYLSAVDLLPTFCEIAGVKLPAGYTPDGVSQVTALKGNGKARREKPLFWKYPSPWPAQKFKPDHWVSFAVVHDRWKLAINRDSKHVELYDLVADPLEKEDLKAANPKIVKRMLMQLDDWKATLPAKPTGDVFSAERAALKEQR